MDTADTTPINILITDDDPNIHDATRFALSDFEFQGRAIHFISAYSGAQAVAAMEKHPDIAVILLDVVMETETDGLEAVRAIRQELDNQFVRIILQTGQPGMMPEKEVIQNYDINAYVAKTDLSSTKLFSILYSALRTHFHMRRLDQARLELLEAKEHIVVKEDRRREAEHSLKTSEQRLSLAVTGGNLGFWDWDMVSGRVTYNDRWADIIGHTIEEIPQTYETWESRIHPDDKAPAMEALQRHINGELPFFQADHRLKTKDGVWRWVQGIGKISQTNAQGDPVRVTGIMMDIDLRKTAQESLELSLSELTALNRLGREINSELSLDGVLERAMVPIGEATRPALAMILLEQQGKLLVRQHYSFDALSLDSADTHVQDAGLALSQKAFSTKQALFSRDINRDERCRATTNPSDIRGYAAIPLVIGQKAIGVMVLGCITPRRFDERRDFLFSMAEILAAGINNSFLHEQIQNYAEALEERVADRTRELRKEKEVAEKASRAKTDFLARMSHEIRTPMNAIINLTDVVLESGLGREQTDYLRVVAKSGRHLLSLINDILDLSKVESGRMELEYAPFDLSKTLETTIASLSQQAKKKGLLLDFKIETGLHTFLKGDANRLQQVLLNLTGNAIKFTRTGGITISVSSSDIPCAPADNAPAEKRARLLFRIEDTGIGIEAAHKSTIFEAFGQADVTTSRKYGGTGLGLTISKQIIRMMDGDIWFVSEPGRGTVFHFSVCLDKGSPGDIQPGSAPGTGIPDREQPARILLAEDNPDNVKVARAMIARLGHQVTVTHNGMAVMEQLRQAPFDLILMDVEMPVMDGLETTRLIRAGNAGEQNRSIRIIALTAHALTGYREKCLEAGMDDYISKPFDPMDLARIIGRAGPGTPPRPDRAPSPNTGEKRGTKVLDSAKAIRRLWGDRALYEDICRDFIDRCPTQLEALEAHLEEETLENAAMVAHTLKGNCGNIGAPECQGIAAELESAARSKDRDRAKVQLRRLVRAAAALRNALYAHLSDSRPRDNAPPRPSSDTQSGPCTGTLAQCLEDLGKSLEKGRDDDGLLDCITAHWPEGADNTLVKELSRHIENFDFTPALETLDRMSKALQRPERTPE